MENKFDISKNSHPRDANISFQDEGHIYTIKDFTGTITSVTTLIKKYFPEFNSDEGAKKKIANLTIEDNLYPAIKEIVLTYYPDLDNDDIITKMSNMIIDDCGYNHKDIIIVKKVRSLRENDECYQKIWQFIKEEWKQNGIEASTDGTAMHKDIENFFLHLPIKNPDSKEFKLFLQFWEEMLTINPSFAPFRSEWIVWDQLRKDAAIAGSIDLVLTDGNGNIIIIDWKRSKDIKFENRWQKAAAPFQQFDDCNFCKYSLQLNFYRHMLETRYDKKVVLMLIVVLHPNQDKYLSYPVDRINIAHFWPMLV